MSLSFPASPTVGQVYQSWVWNGSAWTPQAVSLAPLGIRVFPATTVYVPSPGVVCAIVECVGGGAGGASVGGSGGPVYCGGGGGSGGYSKKFVTAAQIGASQNITIGPGGAGGASGTGNTGSDGGVTSFGSLCVANGGKGGLGTVAFPMYAGGAGGSIVGAVGDVVAAGCPGESGSLIGAGFGGFGGSGGSSAFGGGASAMPGGTAAVYNGNNAFNYGSGGSSALNNSSSGATAGGAGSPGVCVVTEFGSSAPVLWTSPTRMPGDRVLLSSQVVAAPVAAVDFTGVITSTYDEYELRYWEVNIATAPGALCMRVSTDNGATWRTGANDYQWSMRANPTGTPGVADVGSQGDIQIQLERLTHTSLQSSSVGEIKIFRPTSAGVWQAMLTRSRCFDATYGFTSVVGHATFYANSVATPYNAIRIFNPAYNITRGTFKLYGIQK